MKYLIGFFVVLFSGSLSAQIYIDYPDGTTYTVKEHERVFVTPADVYMNNSYQNGGIYFQRIHPSTKRDSTYIPHQQGVYRYSHALCWGGVAENKLRRSGTNSSCRHPQG